MGEFRRQQSKVWWANDEGASRLSGFLGWGSGVDLSGELPEAGDTTKSAEIVSISTLNKSLPEGWEQSPAMRRVFKTETVTEESDEETAGRTLDWVAGKPGGSWDNAELAEDRTSSSSPSQGSHKSQDSGFSDSELQQNAGDSPQPSPDLSKRLAYNTYEANLNKTEAESKEEVTPKRAVNIQMDYNKNISALKKLQASPAKSFTYQVVEFREDCCSQTTTTPFLETAFDGEENRSDSAKGQAASTISPVPCKRRNLIKTHLRSKNENLEKLNQIQNKLELSSKLPKITNLPQNLKVSNLITQFQSKPQEESRSKYLRAGRREEDSDVAGESTDLTSASESEEHTVIEKVTNDVFKVPKRLAETAEDRVSFKGSNNFLNLTEIEGPPVSSSTPLKVPHRQESPLPKPTRAKEKIVASTSTFAIIRKLKGVSQYKEESSTAVPANRYAPPPTRLDVDGSVRIWLVELRVQCEPEVMSTLHSKSLVPELTRQAVNMAASASVAVRKLTQNTKVLSSEFDKLNRHIKCKRFNLIGPLVQNLIGHIKEFVTDHLTEEELQQNRTGDQRKPDENQRTKKTGESINEEKQDDDESTITSQNQRNVDESQEMVTDFRGEEPRTTEVTPTPEAAKKTTVEELEEACEELKTMTTLKTCANEEVQGQVTRVTLKFAAVVDMMLASHIKTLISVVEEPYSENALKTALAALSSLGLEGKHLSCLVTRCGGVRALLAVCLEARATAVRVSAMRTLSTICCAAEAIRQLEQAGGVEILADLLSDETRSEAELSEAAAVLAQITAPWVEDNDSVKGLGDHLSSLVVALTRMVKEYKSCETLLISGAALANLTFMEPRTVWPLLEHNTAGVLLQAVRRQGPRVSVFIQEQAATVIANMASVPECRQHLAEHRAVVALLCFLQIQHSPLQRVPEIMAVERVQQKSAIALSRICSDPTVAKQVVELQGVSRLVRLCKEEKERNHSDGVLVACLSALRKIYTICGKEAIEDQDGIDLVKPRLVDSFLLYSAKQESYV